VLFFFFGFLVAIFLILEVAKYVDVLVYEGTTTKQLSDFFCGKFSLFGNKSFGKKEHSVTNSLFSLPIKEIF